jgi:hypothetical protein
MECFICGSWLYKLAQKSVTRLVKSTQNTLEIFLLPIEFTKIVQNEILHIQYTTHNALVLFSILTGRFESEHSF